MKKIVKIVLAATMVVLVGLWVGNSLNVLNKQAEALEENSEVIEEIRNQVMSDRIEELRSSETVEENTSNEEQTEVQVKEIITEVKGTVSINEEPEKEKRKTFDESVVKETAFKLSNSFALANENEKIEGYENKDQFVKEYFMQFMGVNMAHFFVDDFFYDGEDGVYIIGKYAPHLLDHERDFEIKQVGKDYYDVTQTIEKIHPQDASTITYHYEYDAEDNDWDIWSITYGY